MADSTYKEQFIETV